MLKVFFSFRFGIYFDLQKYTLFLIRQKENISGRFFSCGVDFFNRSLGLESFVPSPCSRPSLTASEQGIPLLTTTFFYGTRRGGFLRGTAVRMAEMYLTRNHQALPPACPLCSEARDIPSRQCPAVSCGTTRAGHPDVSSHSGSGS